MNTLQLLETLPKEIEYLILAYLTKDRESCQAFSLSCKSNTYFLKDSAFWRIALADQRRVVPAGGADNLKSLICRFYKRVYAEDFCPSKFFVHGAKILGVAGYLSPIPKSVSFSAS